MRCWQLAQAVKKAARVNVIDASRRSVGVRGKNR